MRVPRRDAKTQHAGIRVCLQMEGIHSFHLVSIKAKGTSEFSLEMMDCRFFSIDHGNSVSDHLVTAVKSGDEYKIVASVFGTYAQMPVRKDEELRFGRGPGTERVEYGVRFYPFISSTFRICLRAHQGALQQFDVMNASDVRLLWSQAQMTDGSGENLPRQVAHSEAGWRESLSWLPRDFRPQQINLQIPVRANGRAIGKAVLRPMFTWMASMVGIVLAAELGTSSVVVVSVVGTWSFLLREWADSARSHQMNILAALLIYHAVAASIWGLALVTSKVAVWVLVGLFTFLSIDLFGAAVRFEYSGRLPRRMAVPWAMAAKALESLRARRRRRFRVASFDHEGRVVTEEVPSRRRRFKS